MDRFLKQQDVLADLINTHSATLFSNMQKMDAGSLGMPDYCLHYFKASHAKRLFFSIETSAHLLYNAIRLTGKQPSEIIIMDYGAGVGTLYLLAKMIGCNKVVYSDHLDDWRMSAQLIAEALNIQIDHYIVGDIDDCLNRLALLQFKCAIITSRNVIEHIYKLDQFYAAIHKRQPQAIVYSSTTANKQNPAAVVKHIIWHRKWERVYRGMRSVVIQRQAPGLSGTKVHALAVATRGLAGTDLKEAVEEYRRKGKKPNPSIYGSNTCDPSNGVWAEHLLSKKEYSQLINEENYHIQFSPGFWDTHYAKSYLNLAGKLMNRIIAAGGKKALVLAPFMYVIAIADRK